MIVVFLFYFLVTYLVVIVLFCLFSVDCFEHAFFFFFFKFHFPLSTSVEHFVCMCKHLYQVKNTNEVVEYLTNTVSLQDQNVGTKGQPDSRAA